MKRDGDKIFVSKSPFGRPGINPDFFSRGKVRRGTEISNSSPEAIFYQQAE